MAEQEKSVGWVIGALMFCIAALGWGFMAAEYAHNAEGWRTGGAAGGEEGPVGPRSAGGRALADFVGNSFEQLANLPAVIGFTFSRRIWLPIVIVVLEVVVVFVGIKMKSLEKELGGGPRQRRRPGGR